MSAWASRAIGMAATCVLACGDSFVPPGLVATLPEPAGPNCASGGYAIQTGRDLDDNGVLDPSEVTSTVYVCQPAAAPRELVAVVPEPAGLHCAEGGDAIEIGV